MSRFLSIFFIIAAVATLTAQSAFAARTFDRRALRKVDPSVLPSVGMDGNLPDFKVALQRQIDTCLRQNLQEKRNFGGRWITRRKWCVETNREFLSLANSASSFEELMSRARNRFDWYQSIGRDGQGEVLFTGYNFPHLQASLSERGVYRFPIYEKPADLVQIREGGKNVWRRRLPNGSTTAYFTREEIDSKGALRGRGLELGYADDLFSVFVLQVQGAGGILIQQPDGSSKKVILNYAGQNGHPYVEISKILRDRGLPRESVTIPGLRKYFREHPEELVSVLNMNPSYVFFTESSEGPYGVDSILLTPWHSVAMDLRVFPVGAVAFVQTQRPSVDNGEVSSWKDFGRLVVHQDTGGAIRGPGRVDVYWGEDDYAEMAAGTMAQKGSLFFAVVKDGL